MIFSSLADALQWIIQQKGVEHIFHYIDDFITVGKPRSEDKAEGPATTLPFLGTEIDMI